MLSMPSILNRHIPALRHCLVWLVVPIGKRHRFNGQKLCAVHVGNDIALVCKNIYEFGISMILERGAMACWRFGEGGRGAMCQGRGTPRPTCLRWDKPPSTPRRRVPQSPSPSHARVAILIVIHHYHSLLLLRTPPFTPLAPNHSAFG